MRSMSPSCMQWFFFSFFYIKILVKFNPKIANLVKFTLQRPNFLNFFVKKWWNFFPNKTLLVCQEHNHPHPICKPLSQVWVYHIQNNASLTSILGLHILEVMEIGCACYICKWLCVNWQLGRKEFRGIVVFLFWSLMWKPPRIHVNIHITFHMALNNAMSIATSCHIIYLVIFVSFHTHISHAQAQC